MRRCLSLILNTNWRIWCGSCDRSCIGESLFVSMWCFSELDMFLSLNDLMTIAGGGGGGGGSGGSGNLNGNGSNEDSGGEGSDEG